MLSPSERKALKARAHPLEPVVIVGARGLTDDVVAEIDRALRAHELIKVRAPSAGRDDKKALLREICAATGALEVQAIGKIFVIFRKNDS